MCNIGQVVRNLTNLLLWIKGIHFSSFVVGFDMRVAIAAIWCPNCSELALFEGHQMETDFSCLNVHSYQRQLGPDSGETILALKTALRLALDTILILWHVQTTHFRTFSSVRNPKPFLKPISKPILKPKFFAPESGPCNSNVRPPATPLQCFPLNVTLLGPEKSVTISKCHNNWWFYSIKFVILDLLWFTKTVAISKYPVSQ